MLSPLLHDLPGSFLKSPIRVESRKSSLRSNVVVVNLHGTYGIMHGSNGKYRQLAERVADSGFAHSVIYSSSRDWKKQESSDGSYESKMNIFRGKTFENELEDARKTVADIVKNAENRFGISPNDLKILLHGNSL